MMTEEELIAMIRKSYPKYASYPDDVMVVEFLKLFPEYRNRISPVQQKIKGLIERPTERPYVNPFTTTDTKQRHRAVEIENNVKEAQGLHEMDMILEAQKLNVPREALAQIKVMAHENQMYIERYGAEANIDIQTSQSFLLQAIAALDTIQRTLFALFDERQKLIVSADPAKDHKIRVLTTQIQLLEEDFSERAKQTLSQADTRAITQGRDPDPEGERDD